MGVQQKCDRLVDKYIELELVIIVLDLLLLRPQVYRHLLFNRMKYHDSTIDVRTPSTQSSMMMKRTT